MIFVTGGSGLIGSFLIPALLARGQRVRALYRQQLPAAPWASEVEWVQGDVRDSSILWQALQGVTHVFHCAGLVSYAPQDEEALQRVNVEGTAALVDACLHYPGLRLGCVSSVAALGSPPAAAEEAAGPRVVDESAKWDLGAEHPAYATSKYLAELEVWRGISEGLRAVIVNPSIVLGPADWARSSTRLFRYAYQEHAFYTPGRLNFVDVRDVVACMLRLTLDSDVSGERYVLSAASMELREFLTRAAAAFGKKPPTIGVAPWAAEFFWRAEHLRAVLTGSRPLITKDTARASRRATVYRTTKVQQATGITFRPLPETIAWCCAGLQTNHRASGAVVVA